MQGIPKAPRLRIVFAAQFAASILLLSLFAQSASASFASKEMRTLDSAAIDRITRMLEERIECVMSDQGSLGATLRSVTISTDAAVVRVNISKSYLPANVDYMGAELEDRLSALQNVVLGIIENELGYGVRQVLFLFDGRPLEFYYPNDFATQARSAGGSGLSR
ncbi:GerMN domain-containing protein [Luteimonas sp. TWI1437]|uniref:GerMN domain-containing protein n=1 Tax=unclassified Luteimonas TaxID=2629088 RepID=UPI0032081C3B